MRLVLAPLILAAALLPAGHLAAQSSAMERGARGYTFRLSDGEPISYFLEHSRELELSDTQKTQLMNVRRRLRARTEGYMQQMDSLRRVMGISLDPTARLTDDVLERIRRFQEAAKPLTDSVRVLNDAARNEARTLLQPGQLVTLDSLLATGRRGRSGRPPIGPSR
jgi:hypothetical protein